MQTQNMAQSTFYIVSESIAQRSGQIQKRYRTKDGRFILDDHDLRRVNFTADEYTNGLQGIEVVTKEQAMRLIKENNNQMGRNT